MADTQRCWLDKGHPAAFVLRHGVKDPYWMCCTGLYLSAAESMGLKVLAIAWSRKFPREYVMNSGSSFRGLYGKLASDRVIS